MNITFEVWKTALANPRFRILLLIGFLYFLLSLKIITSAISMVDQYPGWVINDPLHHLLPAPYDFSNLLFILTYSLVLLVIGDAIRNSPLGLVQILFAIATMKLLRSLSIFLVPLEAPIDIIPLIDPLVNNITPGQVVVLKDLFFSGHTATVFLLAMLAISENVRQYARAMAVVIPALILWQRVHYTVDILGGILVALVVFQWVEKGTMFFLEPAQKLSSIPQRIRKRFLRIRNW